MSLHYKHISAEEDQMRNLLEKGEYPFYVKSIIEKKTKSGQYDMLELELGIIDKNGHELRIKDWVVLMDEMAWKFRHLSATCGLLDLYEQEAIESNDFVGKQGMVKINISEYEKEGESRKVNRVADYLAKPVIQPQKVDDNPFIDDMIPPCFT